MKYFELPTDWRENIIAYRKPNKVRDICISSKELRVIPFILCPILHQDAGYHFCP